MHIQEKIFYHLCCGESDLCFQQFALIVGKTKPGGGLSVQFRGTATFEFKQFSSKKLRPYSVTFPVPVPSRWK